MKKRFYVDERLGCIALRDRTKASDSPRLHSDLPDVILFFAAVQVPNKPCPTCKHVEGFQWFIPDGLRKQLQDQADQLNSIAGTHLPKA